MLFSGQVIFCIFWSLCSIEKIHFKQKCRNQFELVFFFSVKKEHSRFILHIYYVLFFKKHDITLKLQLFLSIQFADKKVHFLLKSDDTVIDPLSIEATEISDSNWHNVSVTASGTVYKLDLDGQNSGTRNFGVSFDFNSLDIVEMAVSGKASVPNSQEMNGKLRRQSCLSEADNKKCLSQ